MRPGFTALLALGLALPAAPVWAQGAPVPEPNSYRTDNYRAPVPATLQGAQILATPEAAALWRSGKSVFVDVLPHPPRPGNLPEGTLWRDKPRLGIPGSLWLPNTGYGALNPAMEDYFRSNLERATAADRSKMLVFFCLKDCWMSWNAAKRALSLGYSNVAWYPDGTDGWKAAGLPLENTAPAPRPEG